MIMRLRESNLPGEIVWQFSMNLLTRPDHFSAPVALRKIVRRREVVLIFVRIGYGRVPSANPIQCGRDRDLYRLMTLVACRVGLRPCAGHEILHGPFESAGPLHIQRMTPGRSPLGVHRGPAIVSIPNYKLGLERIGS
jgi:hypothetical protein